MMVQRESNEKWHLLNIFILLGGGILIVIISFLPEKNASDIIREGGVVESMSAVGWLISTLILIVKKRFVLASLPLFCGMRELDLHKQWTTDSVLKSKYYLGDYVNNDEKILAAIVVIIFAAVIISACVIYARPFFRNLRYRKPWAIGVFFSIALLFVSKVFLDGIGRKLSSLGVEFDAPFIFTIVEEVMELTSAVLVLAVLIVMIKKSQK